MLFVLVSLYLVIFKLVSMLTESVLMIETSVLQMHSVGVEVIDDVELLLVNSDISFCSVGLISESSKFK